MKNENDDGFWSDEKERKKSSVARGTQKFSSLSCLSLPHNIINTT